MKPVASSTRTWLLKIAPIQGIYSSAAKRLLNQGHRVLLPPTSDKFVLANEMGSFFVEKINAIQVKLDRLADCLHDCNFDYVNTSLTTTLDNFIPLRWPNTCASAGAIQRARKDCKKQTCRHFIYSKLVLSVLVPVSRTSFVLLHAALFSVLCFGSLVCHIYSLILAWWQLVVEFTFKTYFPIVQRQST